MQHNSLSLSRTDKRKRHIKHIVSFAVLFALIACSNGVLFQGTVSARTSSSNAYVSAADYYAEDPDAINDSSFQEIDGKIHLLNPTTGAYLPIVNAVDDLQTSYQSQRTAAQIATPPPNRPILSRGGVGYGFTYKTPFQTGFSTSTTIAHDIICPNSPGTGVTTDLYLTSTNRASKGCEALIWYNGNTTPAFWIYDWGPTGSASGFVFGLSYSDLVSRNFLANATISGATRQVICVQNRTSLVSGSTWRNTVWVVDHRISAWVQVYTSIYTSSLAEQRSGFQYWGPIIETFQSSYSRTNVLGFSNSQLASDGGSFIHLSSSNSALRNDGVGFSQNFLNPNHTWGASAR